MELREYQKKLVKDSFESIKELGPGCGIVNSLATGAGKTVVGIQELRIYNSMLPDRPLAWLTHRDELRRQSSDRIKESGLVIKDMSADSPSDRKWYKGVVNIVSPQMRKWPKVPKLPGLLLVDECHHTPAATWARLIEEWQHQGGVVIGLTATLWRMSNRQGFTDWYQTLLVGPTIAQLQEQGYLATPKVIAPQRAQVDDTEAEIDSMGEFSKAWLEEEVIMMLAQKPVVESWQSYTENLDDDRTLWFLPTVHSANMLRTLLGYRARVLTGKTPRPVRQRMLKDLESHKITHLVSVDVLGEGLDIPSVPIIASLRPTQSLAIWLQQCGRGARPKNDTDGGYYIVFDFSGNAQRHGSPDLDRQWSLEPRSKTKGLLPQDIVGRCYSVQCDDVHLHPAHRECWNCNQPQYKECMECRVHRRWTRFRKKMLICDLCNQYAREVQRENQTRTGTNELIRSKIKRYTRQKPNQQLQLFE